MVPRRSATTNSGDINNQPIQYPRNAQGPEGGRAAAT
jgi:hypothetical protein